MNETVPADTIRAFARTIYKEAASYGFGQVDLLRLVNELMDLYATAGASGGAGPVNEQPARRGSLSPSNQAPRLPIVGERVTIRAYDPAADAPLLQEWLKDRYGRHFLESCATAQPMTLDALARGATSLLGVITLKDGTAIGAMAYVDHNVSQRRAEVRKLIGAPEARGKGLAKEATKLWIDYGISALGLEKIVVTTLQTHIANIRLNEEIGFRIEGLLHNEVLVDDKRHDVLRMGIWFD